MLTRRPTDGTSRESWPDVGLQLRMLGTLARFATRPRGGVADFAEGCERLLAYLALTPCATPRSRLCVNCCWTRSAIPAARSAGISASCAESSGPRPRPQRRRFVPLRSLGLFVDALEINEPPGGVRHLAPERRGSCWRGSAANSSKGSTSMAARGSPSWLLAQRRRFHAWRVALLRRLVEMLAEAEAHRPCREVAGARAVRRPRA